jgi:hypothetical protein
MSSTRRASVAIVIAGCVATACAAPPASVGPSSVSSTGASVAHASVTPNPNQLARQSATPPPSSPTVAPQSPAPPSATPIRSPEPLTEMETKLPALAGGGGSDPHRIEGSTLFGGFVDQVAAAQRLFDAVGATAADFDGAAARCCSAGLDVFDMRIRGVAATSVADAFVEVVRQVEPGSVRSSRTVDGITVVRLRWSATTPHDLHVAVIDDIVYGFSGDPKRQADVDATIAFMRRPRLDDLLPATIGGQPTMRASLPASAIPTAGDMCSVVCPLEAPNLAKALKVPINDIDLGYAVATSPGVYVLAFRVPGASNAGLIHARIESYGDAFGAEVRRIGGKSVTWSAPDPFPDSSQHEYLYAHDQVLFSIRPAKDDGPPNAAVIEAIKALP